MSADVEAALTPRQETILDAVCRDYVTTGREVASAGLIRTHGFPWSSATIRQELAALERKGYLQREHCSAGRLPTRAAMEHYVLRLPKAKEPPRELALAVDCSVRSTVAVEHGVRAAACVLSEVAGCVAISFVGLPRDGLIVDIDVVPLLGMRALVVATLDSGATMMQPISVERLLSGRSERTVELLRLQERLRWLCRGRTLAAARAELARLQREQEARADRLLAEAIRVGMALCAGVLLDPLWLQVAGQPSLVRDVAQFDRLERLQEVLELLEDVQRLADVLCQLLPEPEAAEPVASVRLGADDLLEGAGDAPDAARRTRHHGVVDGLTVVGCRIPAGAAEGGKTDPRRGAVAVLGSDRMDYAAVIPLVEYAARALAAQNEA